MGIRFKCPNGHKINVKSFLAGKKALCPDCGAKVVVPFESEARDSLAAAVDAKRTGTSEASAPAAATAATATSAAPVSAHGPATPVAVNAQAVTAAIAHPAPAPVPKAPAPVVPAAAMADPISESPLAVWYVRPRSGGQYGPAPGEIFRQWISEKRVAADSLVWRDGWPDWRLASEVLPQFSARPPAVASQAPLPAAGPIVPAMAGAGAMTPAAVAAPAESPTLSASARYVRSRKSRTSTIVAISLLGIVAIALLAVLIIVLQRTP